MNPFLDHIVTMDLNDKKARKEFMKKAMGELRNDIRNYNLEDLQQYFLKQNFILLHSAFKIQTLRRDLETLTELLILKDNVLRRYRTSMDLQDKEIQKAVSIIRAQRRIISSYNIPEEEDEL